MLTNINPLLTGQLLLYLDQMGHSDTVLIADAHFPAARLAARLIDLPGASAPEVTGAVRSVLPLDDVSPLQLMTSADGSLLPVQQELTAAAGLSGAAEFIDRYAFYNVAHDSFVIIRTGETRTYGNAILRKGLVGAAR